MEPTSPSRPPAVWAALGTGCLMGLVLGIVLGALVQLYFPNLLGWLVAP